MSSTFKNRIPKRKYRERVQPAEREGLGFLQKKKDYKERAKNFHKKEDMINKLKLKASTKNEDQFYFKMLKGKKTENGIHIEQSDEEFDQRELRAALKTENYSLVSLQRSIVQKKIQKLRATLQMISQAKPRKHIIFTENHQKFENFEAHEHFKTTKDLMENNLLEVNPQALGKQDMQMTIDNINVKDKYNKLAELLKKQENLTKVLLRLGYEKNLLGKERKMIKKNKKNGTKVHKFFMERKK